MSVATLALALALAAAQQPPAPGPAAQDTTRREALRLFLDCDQCDFDYLRTEITFVNYVRDRADAQLQVLVTTQRTGGGGTEYTLSFLGLREYQGRDDTLRFVTQPASTRDEVRRAVARMLRLGLVRYVASTPLAERLEISYRAPEGPAEAARQRADPWNFWVFSVSANSFLSGEKLLRSRDLWLSLDANRTTERWKVSLSVSGSSSRSSFEIDDSTTFVSRREYYSGSALVVRSWGPHWSFGGRGSVIQESFRNIELRARFMPTLEYSVFPYSQSTRRLLLLRYSAGVETSNYTDTTIFGRVSETRAIHGLEGTYTVTQPWGSASARSNFTQYAHDRSKINLTTSGNVTIRLVRGLSLEVWGRYSVIRDQLYLPAAGATPEEIIARQRQLATSYSYYGGFGLQYRFGSLYNNIVNPRFR